MCDRYGIKKFTYEQRIKNGWDQCKALEKPIPKRTVVDHYGKEHDSVEKMCRAYNVPVSTYEARIRRGLSLKVALERTGRR